MRPDAERQLAKKVEKAVEAQITRDIGQAIEQEVFSRAGRATILAKRRQALLEVIASRAVFEVALGEQHNEPVPGAETGMVVSTMKAVGSKTVKTHSVDIKLLEELRATEQQIARELGQWVDKTDQTQSFKRVEDIPTALLEELIRRGEEKLRQLEAQKLIEAGGEVVDVEPAATPAENENDVSH